MQHVLAIVVFCISVVVAQYFPPSVDNGVSSDPNTIYTPYGIIKGQQTSLRGVRIQQFFGIPYAKPPVGKLRFKKPKPLPWKKSRLILATKLPPSCPQTRYYFDKLRNNENMRFSEDCLYLNVWTAQRAPLQPVLVLIHGGFFTHGGSESPALDMSHLTARGIVCVSFNYRLNALGFLYAGVSDAPGNMGLYDQQLALQWIRKHIHYFGGDPKRITVMGYGAGATAAAYHLLNPVSRKIFKRAILQSGNPFSIMSLNQPKTAATRAATVAKRLGCLKDGMDMKRDSFQTLRCILSKDAGQVAKAAELEFTRGELSLMPLFESGGFLKKSPEQLLFKEAKMNDIEILMGNSKNEFADSLFYTGYFDAAEEILPGDIKYLIGMFYGTFYRANAVPILKYYFGDDTVQTNTSKLFETGGHAIADGVLVCPGNEFAEEMASRGAKVYYYSFDHESSFTSKQFGVSSSEEILYSLGSLKGQIGSQLAASPDDVQFADDMVELIATFVYYGRAYSPKIPTDWPTYSASKPYLASLKQNMTVGYGPRLEECNFWSYFWNNHDAAVGNKYSHVVLG